MGVGVVRLPEKQQPSLTNYVGIRKRDIRRARKCSRKFFGYPAATRNAPKQSVAGRAGRKDD